ncbi:MAG: 2'-5' RNA ligase family protein [Bryobacteraceae bacterium]|jgi:2'-5' RNA ligase
MSSDPNGPPGRVPAEEWLNVFALVTYIPAPLGEFLDRLRRELVPHDDPRAHVSLLPPRPLAGEWLHAWAEVRKILEHRAAFDVELTGIRTFPVTDVIYLEVGAGAAELCDIHAAMNSNSLSFQEPFAYHPHVTLAQDISHQDVADVLKLAERRWREFRGPRSFRAERAVFVQSTIRDHWLDLAEFRLGNAPVNL